MDVDLIRVLVAVATVGVGLAALTLAGVRGLRREMRGLRQETRDEIQGLRQEIYGTCAVTWDGSIPISANCGNAWSTRQDY